MVGDVWAARLRGEGLGGRKAREGRRARRTRLVRAGDTKGRAPRLRGRRSTVSGCLGLAGRRKEFQRVASALRTTDCPCRRFRWFEADDSEAQATPGRRRAPPLHSSVDAVRRDPARAAHAERREGARSLQVVGFSDRFRQPDNLPGGPERLTALRPRLATGLPLSCAIVCSD